MRTCGAEKLPWLVIEVEVDADEPDASRSGNSGLVSSSNEPHLKLVTPAVHLYNERRNGHERGLAQSTRAPRRLVRAASSPTKVPRWLQAAAPSSVAVRPRTAEGKVAYPRRTYNLEMKRFEICDATLLTRSTSSVFAI